MALFVELFLLGVGLSMDAFAVSVCKGLGMRKLDKKQALIIGLYFGGFQALMPLIGWLLGSQFQQYITSIDHWIAFILLGLIGGHMLLEAIREIRHPEACAEKRPFTLRILLVQAVATRIDALAVGVSFAVVDTNIAAAAAIIGIITCALCVIGAAIGQKCGAFLGQWAKLLGGVILLGIGFKILIEHLAS